MRKMIEKPNITKTFHLGNTTIHVADNFVRTDPAEIQEILDQYQEIGWRIVDECLARGEEI